MPEIIVTVKALLTCIPIAAGFLASGCRSETEGQREAMSFGLIADVQYADQGAVGRRHYREAIHKLEECVADLNAQELVFTVQLGDIIDGGKESLDRALSVYDRLNMEKYHVLGNHDFPMERQQVLAAFGLERAYYTLSRGGWRFVVLDSQDIGLWYGWPEGSGNRREAERLLDELRERGEPNAVDWNGAIGEEQKEWLRETLREASEKAERAIVFCHMPVLPASCDPVHLLWNHEEVVAILESCPSAVACFSGHDHGGGYAEQNGIHYVTFEGMVEAPEQNAYAVVALYEDRIEIRGAGKVRSRTLPISR